MPDHDEVDYDDHETHVQAHREARKSLSSLSPEVREAMERDAEKIRQAMKEEMEKLDLEAWKKKNQEQQNKIKEERRILAELPPSGYLWVNKTIGLAMCDRCGSVVYTGVLALNGTEVHNLWHIQMRELYKVVALKVGGLNAI